MQKQKGVSSQGHPKDDKKKLVPLSYTSQNTFAWCLKRKSKTHLVSQKTDSSDLGRTMHFLAFIKIVVIYVSSPLFWGSIKTLWPSSVSAYRHLCLLTKVQFLHFERGPFTDSPRGSNQVHTLWFPNLSACTHSYKTLSFILSHKEWFKNTRHKFSVLDNWVQGKSKNYTHVSNVNHHRKQGF